MFFIFYKHNTFIMDTRIGFLMCVCVYMYVFDFDLRAYWLLFTCYCYYYELLFSFKYFYIILLVFFVNLFSFFFWIDTLRRISCWDLLTGFKSFYMQQLQMQSKFNFSLSLLNGFPFLFSSILSCSLTISFDISCAFSLCIGYCLIINVACSLSMPECRCV